ncbi:MAG: xanthine dehydrogenase family protein molybdopterin-binding subunit [Spirochaetota bacterium]|nr:xanthine dehydrogenase family protein molybdopterin-binding subunit [Spirochaetota bacterium]
MKEMKYIGKDIERPDAVAKATGKAVYLDDVCLPGMLHCAILRPEYAHARIISIDTGEAEKMEGVIKVVTGRDAPGIAYGDNIRDQIPMAVDKVRHIGEPVAAVIAEKLSQARAAVKKIKIEYEPLPVYTDALKAMEKDAVLIHDENGNYWHLPSIKPVAGTNIACEYTLSKGNYDDGMHEADITIEGEFNYPLGSCAALEPHGTIVWFREDRQIEIWSTSICPFIIREDMAHAYGRPISEVRVHVVDLGGCFGYKSDITIEQTIVYIASFVPGYPVKFMSTRREDFTSTLLGHGIRTRMKIGAKKDGTLTALQARVYHTTGAYADTGVNVIMAATHNSGGPYEFPHCDLKGYSVYTNTPPVGAFRGYGHQESHLAVEILMDRLARKLKMDPFELREKNYLGPGKITALGETLWKSNGDVKASAEKVKKAVFGHEKPKEDDRYYYGRGFAALMKSPKGAPFSTKGVYLKFNHDGSISVNMGGAEVGQGLRAVVKQVTAEALLVPPEKIKVYNDIDTQYCPYEWQTIGSMFTTQGGRAIVRAANKAITMMKKTAAQILRIDEDFVAYDGEKLYLKSDPSVFVPVSEVVRGYIYENGITIGEVVQAAADARLPRYSSPDKHGQGSMGVTYTFGAQACEIRIEKETGKILIDHFASCFDVGRVINPKIIRGVVAGGVVMGIGAALHEELLFREDGTIRNPRYNKYHIPRYSEAPGRQTIEFIETPSEIGPFGARGIGEHPLVGVAPSIVNAVYDAVGVEFSDIPLTPDRILEAIRDKR